MKELKTFGVSYTKEGDFLSKKVILVADSIPDAFERAQKELGETTTINRVSVENTVLC